MQVLAVDQGVTVLTAARQAHLHVIHVTFGCYTNDGSDLEFFKQRTIGDEHSKLKKRIVPVRCACFSCCAAQWSALFCMQLKEVSAASLSRSWLPRSMESSLTLLWRLLARRRSTRQRLERLYC